MYDLEHMDPRLIAYVNIFICANRLQAIMDSGLEDITAKQWLALTMIDSSPRRPRAATQPQSTSYSSLCSNLASATAR